MSKQLNIILDIDNTLLEFMVKDAPWDALPAEERSKYTPASQGSRFVLRPEFNDFFAWMKKLAKTVNLWTLSDEGYANDVKDIIESKMGRGFITNVWCDTDAEEAIAHPRPGGKNQKNLHWIWDQEKYAKQGFMPCNTILIDDYSHNVDNLANYRNAIRIKKFALWSRVTKRDPFGPYVDMSKDRSLLDVVDELKKIDQSSLCGRGIRPLPEVAGASDASPRALALHTDEAPAPAPAPAFDGSNAAAGAPPGGRRRRSTRRRKFKRHGSRRRSGTARKSGGARS